MDELRAGRPPVTAPVLATAAALPAPAALEAPLTAPPVAPLVVLGKPAAKVAGTPVLVPLDAVSAVMQGALGPPTSGGPLTAHGALRRARALAARILGARPTLALPRLDQLLDQGKIALDRAKHVDGQDAGTLARAYVHLAEAETFAQAVLDEAVEGRGAGYGARADAARALLREVGAHYAVRCPQFTRLMQGDAEWPTRYEKVDGRLHFINGFKSKAELDPAQAQAAFDQRLHTFLAAGGVMSAIQALTAESLDRLEVGEKYEYVLTAAGDFRFTVIPKTGDGPSPGHTLTAEAGVDFHHVRALCAGELWVSRDSDGELSALCISAGSGHYKPFFDALAAVDGPLVAMGVDAAKIVHYGGPSSARDAARSLFGKAGVDGEEQLPPPVHELRLALARSDLPGA